MAELVVAPLLEPFENRVEAPFGMAFELPEDRDVSGITDLLGKVGRVEDEFGTEVGVLLCPGEKPEIDPDAEVLERVIDEAGVPRFVPGHEGKELTDVRIVGSLLHLRVEHATGEFRSHRTHEKIDEFLAQRLRQALDVHPEIVRPDEVPFVGVAAHFRNQLVPLSANRAYVGSIEFIEIRRIEAWAEDRVLLRDLRRLVQRTAATFDRDHDVLPSEKPTS
jgi:hypothetical protein